MSFGCRGARSRAGARAGAKYALPWTGLARPSRTRPQRPDTAFSPGDARPVRDTRPVYVTGRGQWAYRQMALRTRSRSTCLRPTSKGSTALMTPASHAAAPPVHPAPVIGAAGYGARSCGITSGQTSASAGLIPLRWKTAKTLPARDALGSAGWMALLSAGQRRSAPVSPGGSSPPAARSHGAEGAGSHTRCRRGSRRDGAPGMERRSCAYLLAISARRQDEVRAVARSCWHRAAARTS